MGKPQNLIETHIQLNFFQTIWTHTDSFLMISYIQISKK